MFGQEVRQAYSTMASLSHISIQRPVLAWVMSLVVILFGVIGYTYLGVREYPSVDSPIVTVTTNYTGANAEVIGSQITEPLEESINGISGIKNLSSVSRDGRSTITVEFELGIDMDAAANDVRDRVSRSAFLLPKDVDPPTVQKADADANPIVYLGVRSSSKTILETSDFASRVLKERLQTIPGVSQVTIWGEKKYSMRLWMDPDKMAAMQVTPQDVQLALNRENVELPGGRVEGLNTELSIRTMGRLQNVQDFNNLIIAERGDQTVKLQDIGYAALEPENYRSQLTDNGVPMVAVVLIPQPGTNQIEIVDEFNKRLTAIEKSLPKDYTLVRGFDNTTFIRASLTEVEETIITSFLLVVVVIFLFLRDARTTFIPVLAIPISLIGTFFLMYLFGFSINVLTMLGIVLAIGLVVDDAIVVLENIYTKIESGMNPLQAAKEGSAEIYFAVISTTVVLAAVFLPLIFLEGISGRLFKEFGIVVAGSVVISAFVSLTLTPMLSSRLLKHRARQPWFYRVTEPAFVALGNAYEGSLRSFLKRPWIAVVFMMLSFGAIWWLRGNIPGELAPTEDRNGLRLVITGPEGATYDYMKGYVTSVATMVNNEVPDSVKKSVIAITSPGILAAGGVNSGFVRVMLTDADKRKITQQELVDRITPKVKQYTGAKAFVATEPTIAVNNGIGALPLQMVIQANTLDELQEVLPTFMKEAQGNQAFAFADVNLKFNKPELRITINRDKARNLGVNVQDIAQTLQLSVSEQRFGYFLMGGKQYQIIGMLDRDKRDEPLDLTAMYVRNIRGELIQLDNLVEMKETSTPPQIYRFNRFVSATVSAQLAKGYTLGQGMEAMTGIAKKVLPPNMRTEWNGQARDFQDSSSSLLLTFMLALLLIYLVMAAQFESFVSPLIVMFTVPLALLGALASLWYWHQTLNIFSQIGIIMLIGLVTKNGILIVEFANQQLEEGFSVKEAVRRAADARFRPILMTSLCTILGIAPIALALGAGAESRVSMGIGVIGGMVMSTLLSLYVVPALYAMMVKQPKHVVPITGSQSSELSVQPEAELIQA